MLSVKTYPKVCKEILACFRPVFFLFLFGLSNNIIHGQDVTGTWSGTMTMHTVWDGIDGPTELWIDLDIQDNKVTGTVKKKEKLIIGGKQEGYCNCAGTGTGELWRVSLNADSTYDIQAISPNYTCDCESSSGSEKKDAGKEDVLVSSEKIKDRNFLFGSSTVKSDSPLGSGTTTVTWNLHQGPLDLVFLIKPESYESWLPEPGRDEDTHGSVLNVNLEVKSISGKPLPMRVGAFELRLNNTSREPGICINAPVNPGDPHPDLQFIHEGGGDISEEGQFVFTNSPDGKTGSAKIGAFDGGGWSTLTGEAVMENGMRIKGKLLTQGGPSEVLIPKRQPGNHIADAWLKNNGNPGEMDDKEISKNNNNPGDGLTAYEEYRGVMSIDTFRRLKPTIKELGLLGKKGEASVFNPGVSWFESATGIKVIKFKESEIGDDRRLNKNALTSHDYDQYVLKIENGPTSKSAAGENRPTNLDHMVPKQSDLVVINVAYIDEVIHQQDSASKADHMAMPYTREELLASTVAHELAHGVDVNHHGEPSNAVQGRIFYEGGNIPVHIFDNHQHEIPVQSWPLESGTNRHYYRIFGDVGDTATQESGDLSCLMAYTSMYNWAFHLGSDGSLNYYMVPPLPIGRILCTRVDGTGINALPVYFGKAKQGRGNCAAQVRLK